MSEAPTLRQLLKSSSSLISSLSAHPSSNTPEYQSSVRDAISQLTTALDLVARASVFSLNESLDDVSTGDLPCLKITFSLADLYTKLSTSTPFERKAALLRALQYYKDFITLLDAYDLVSATDRAAASNAGTGRPVSQLPTDPGQRRLAKIAQFKQEKELKGKIQQLEQGARLDEEEARELHITSLRLAVMQTTQQLEMITMELEMLKQAPPPEERERLREEQDERARQKKDDGYNERLDKIPNDIKGGALLNKDGKPLRPFTLLDKRQQLKDGVFRPGHSLPTMTIDEYLEEERRRGGIIEGGGEKSGEKPEMDLDDEEAVDKEMYKQREWDEFKEANPKGAGNTLNRG
jgi:immunoglobulin-binding protein 1